MNTNQKIAELESQLTTIQQELDKLKQVEVEETWPKVGDTYYFVNSLMLVEPTIYAGYTADVVAKSFSNMFRTEEEAEKELEARKVIAELRSQPGSRKFVVGEENCAIDADIETLELEVTHWFTYCGGFGQVYFNTEEDVKNAIKSIGENRILASAKWLAMGV